MARSETERTTIEQFDQSYRYVTSPVMQSIERNVCGCAYGGTRTTRDEADRIGQALSLAHGKTILEVGAGAGRPSLYLAKETGCSAVLVDLPLEGLRVAFERAQMEGLADRCFAAQADGAALPLQARTFDALSHDLTAAFATSMKRLIEARAAHATQLADLVGADEAEDTSARMRQKLPAVERGLLQRAMFVAEPV
jgi:cyclopropane fatty-acyl-phospholipid synthase-like methyltransferase